MAIGPVVEGKATRDVWIEVNGEVRAVTVEDKNSAVETFTREKASSEPGSVGAPMSGVVVEVRVKEGQEVKKGDVLCVQSAMKVSSELPVAEIARCLRFGSCSSQMESAVSAPVSGHVARVVVQEGEFEKFSTRLHMTDVF